MIYKYKNTTLHIIFFFQDEVKKNLEVKKAQYKLQINFMLRFYKLII